MEAGLEQVRRREQRLDRFRQGLLWIVFGLCVAGAVIVILRQTAPALDSSAAARAPRTRVRTSDRFVCNAPGGALDEMPDWDYLCEDASHPARMGYWVETGSHGITRLEPAG